MNFQCPTEFNVVTQFKRCSEVQKELQEMTDPLRYRFDLKPPPGCMMPGMAFGGLSVTSQRRPPVRLMDVEMALQALPLKEEENEYIIGDIHTAKPPAMPKILSNRLVIPDCREIMTLQTTKIKKGEFPEWTLPLEQTGRWNNYSRPGLDTRRAEKDAFLEKQKQNTSGSLTKTPLKPVVDTACRPGDSDMDCMNVTKGNPASGGSGIIDPSVPLGNMKNSGALGTSGGFGSSGFGNGGVNGSGSMGKTLSSQSGKSSVSNIINPTVPFSELLNESIANQAASATFYNYRPKC